MDDLNEVETPSLCNNRMVSGCDSGLARYIDGCVTSAVLCSESEVIENNKKGGQPICW